MRRNIFLLFAMLMLLLSASCASDNDTTDTVSGATAKTQGESKGNAGGKTLLVYFSRAGENWQVGMVEKGNTAVMAGYISDYADVMVFELVLETAYPVGYEDCKTVATAEFNANARPKLKDKGADFSEYDSIFIGGPIWWGRPPMLFRTFFEAHAELDGKTIIPFGTHGGSGVGSYASLIAEYYPNADVLKSLGISGSEVRSEGAKTSVENWLATLGIPRK